MVQGMCTKYIYLNAVSRGVHKPYTYSSLYNILHLRAANSEQQANKNWCVCLTHGESNKEWQSVRHNKVETEMRIEQMHTAHRIK